ncbi:MAG: DUF3127 domain-containing protein [Bacteroidales bacterium]|jgi:hypothetical protein|nr:DUF3127 domain-containing protein [Bacteroidales bacterium]MDY0252867.1 DUF3127 domain-containing protein [Tenuifilaceae bacterium]
MEISGKLVEKLPQQTGQGRNGQWVKQEFILETQEQYPRKVCIALWGDKAREIDSIAIGESLKASINVESREFNGKWYTDVKAWRIEKLGAAGQSGADAPPTMPSLDELPPDIPQLDDDAANDLPF